jgi:hypothetical protein
LYAEQNSSNITFRRNFVWDCGGSLVKINSVKAFTHFYGNIGIARANSVQPVISITQGGDYIYCDADVYNNVGIGFNRLADAYVPPSAWVASTIYAVGNVRVNGGNFYKCVAGGTSAASGGPTGTGTGIVDLGVTWDYVGASNPIRIRIKNNVAKSNGIGANPNGLRTNTITNASITVDGNQLFGYNYLWFDWEANTQRNSYVTNTIATDPTVSFLNIPTPTDPKVNYALIYCSQPWTVTPDLRTATVFI